MKQPKSEASDRRPLSPQRAPQQSLNLVYGRHPMNLELLSSNTQISQMPKATPRKIPPPPIAVEYYLSDEDGGFSLMGTEI